MAAAAKQNEPRSEGGRPSRRAGLFDQVRARTGVLAEQGLAKLGELAEARKEAAAKQIDGVVEVIENLADAAAAEFGGAVGSAVRQSGGAVEKLARSLRDNSVDDMVAGTRTAISRNPGIAIGVASLVGFVGGRIVKAGLSQASASKAARAHQREGAGA